MGEEKLLLFLAVVSAEWREGVFAAAFLEPGGGRGERKGGVSLRGFLLDMRFSAAFFFVSLSLCSILSLLVC
jgi:hypothetical protein